MTAHDARFAIVAIALATAIALCARLITHHAFVSGVFQ